jgi:hypothetical protein
MNGKLGTLDAPMYFVNHRDPAHPPGFIMMAVYSDQPTPDGYSREYATTLKEVDRLQFTLLEQERRQWERDAQVSDSFMLARRRAIYDWLCSKMVSSSTSPFERDAIAAYLKLKEEKRDKHRNNLEHRMAYLYQVAHELPRNRRANEERVDLDRLELPRE